MRRPSVLLADDHTLVLEALEKLLDPEFDIVSTVCEGRALLRDAETLKPDVVVLDLGMPEMSGMEAGVRLKKLLPGTKLVVLTMNEDIDLASEALDHWASGYLLKKSAGSELINAIREALHGRCYITPKIAQRLQEEFVRDPHSVHKRVLTSRQKEVLQLLAEGRTMREAADALHVTPRTVAFHKYRIMEDFGLKTTSDLVRFAIRERLISGP
jgi:DNA-binding NarL/FixJ family response regulator